MESMKVRTGATKMLGQILTEVAEVARVEDVHRFQGIIESWSTLVGDGLKGTTRPLSLKDGTLTVEVTQIEKPDAADHLKAIVARFGVEKVVLRLQQKQAPITPRLESVSSSAAKRVAAISDEPLRNAMAKLISAYEKSRNHQ